MPILTNATLKQLTVDGQPADQSVMHDLIDSKRHVNDTTGFLAPFDSNKAYMQNDTFYHVTTKQIYRVKADVTPAALPTSVNNTALFERLGGEVTPLPIPNSTTMAALKAVAGVAGDWLLVQLDDLTPKQLGLYRWMTGTIAEDIPYTVNATAGGTWVASGGWAGQDVKFKNASLKGTLTATGNVDASGAVDAGTNVTAGLDLLAGRDTHTDRHHVIANGQNRGGGHAPEMEFHAGEATLSDTYPFGHNNEPVNISPNALHLYCQQSSAFIGPLTSNDIIDEHVLPASPQPGEWHWVHRLSKKIVCSAGHTFEDGSTELEVDDELEALIGGHSLIFVWKPEHTWTDNNGSNQFDNTVVDGHWLRYALPRVDAPNTHHRGVYRKNIAHDVSTGIYNIQPDDWWVSLIGLHASNAAQLLRANFGRQNGGGGRELYIENRTTASKTITLENNNALGSLTDTLSDGEIGHYVFLTVDGTWKKIS